MHLNFEPKIVYMQNNKQTQSLVASHAVVFSGEEGNTTPLKTTAWEAKSLVTLCDVDRYIQQDSNTFNKNCNLFSAMFKI